MLRSVLVALEEIVDRLDLALDSGRSHRTEVDIDNAYRLIAVAEAEMARR